MQNNSYTKLRDGTWGVTVFGAVAGGSTVTVVTKAGASKVETIRSVIWTGGGKSICSIVHGSRTAPRPSGARSYSSSRGGRRTGCHCGSLEGVSRASDCWTCRHDAE